MRPTSREASAADGSQALAKLCDAYWNHERSESPLSAVLAGEPCDDPVLFREHPEDYARRDSAAAAFLAELNGLDLQGLSLQERATCSLLRRELEGRRGLYAVASHLRPALLPVGPDFNTVFYSNSVSIGDAQAAELHAERLARFPAFLSDILAGLREGYARGIRYPSMVLAAAAANTRRIAAAPAEASPWQAPFARSPLAGEPAVARCAARALTLIDAELRPALSAYADALAGPLAVGARETISCADAPDGRAYYAALVRHYTTTEQSPEAIHELGLSEVARLEAEIAELAGDAGFAGDVDAYRRFLTTDPQFVAADAEALRARAAVICKGVDARIPAFFGRIPRVTYGVESVPAALSETLPPAYAQPAPSGGAASGTFWVNGLPDRCPTYLLPAMAVHEAWPGHLMHIGLMAELDHLPAFRRHGATKYTVCVEGWALYCEELGKELGVYRTPHDHYGRLEMEMWRACRLVVDTGIHRFDWPRQKAIDYLSARLTLSADAISAEVDRYAALPAQALAYQIGGLKVRELRRRAEDRLGSRFSHRAFHEAVMTAGAVTLPVLEDLVDGWLAEAA
jgi:uncharacterized protein (DUF885 family)